MTPTPSPSVYKECGETGYVVKDCLYTQALEEVNYASGKNIDTLIPTTKGGEITHTSLGKSREIKGKVRVRTRMCTGPLS